MEIDSNFDWVIDIRKKTHKEKMIDKGMDEVEKILKSIYGDRVIRKGDYLFLNEFDAYRGYPGYDLRQLAKMWNLY